VTQFAICALKTGDELVCRIQTDLGIPTPYLLCAPVVLRAAWGPPVPRLHVPVEIDGVGHLILMTQMLAIPTADLGAVVGSAAAQRDAIVQAVDLLVTGF
jgi:toxin CcdB